MEAYNISITDLPPRHSHKYGEHSLQSLSVWRPTPPPASATAQYWIIYIHGGAWRDPRITAHSFELTIQHLLLSTPSVTPHIAAFASLDYRLSPHPDLPQDKASTPAQEYRDARHPDHIRDVRAGIQFLQQLYGFGSRYVLVGHSCGATLALQCLMGKGLLRGGGREGRGEEVEEFVAPQAIVGVAGIYDLRGLRDRHGEIAAYQTFIEGAFGADQLFWDRVSPATYESFDRKWGEEGRVVVLAHSKGDELIEEEQVVEMEETLSRGWVRKRKIVCLRGETALRGGHDEIWEKGEELARVVGIAIRELVADGDVK